MGASALVSAAAGGVSGASDPAGGAALSNCAQLSNDSKRVLPSAGRGVERLGATGGLGSGAGMANTLRDNQPHALHAGGCLSLPIYDFAREFHSGRRELAESLLIAAPDSRR